MAPLKKGFLNEKPYDLIFINGCLNEYPHTLIEQLSENKGILLTIEKNNSYIKKIVKYTKKDKLIERKEYSQANAPVLESFNLQ